MSNLSRLKGADKIRKRVGVMLGSDDIRGCRQTLFEILSNSIDRFKAGHGDTINVIKKSDLTYVIEDFADGLPMAWNDKENAFNWELATRILYAGGNYTTTKDTHVGQLGLNGLGLASSVLSSEYATITSVRDGKEYVVNYKKGRPVNYKTMEYVCEDSEDLFSFDLGKKILKSSASIEHTGTTVSYRPDLEVFTDIDIPIEWINEKCKKQAIVNKGLTIKVYDEKTNTEYIHEYENGIQDYVEELADGKSISDTITFIGEGIGKDRDDKEDYKVSYEIAFVFNNENPIIECYHNSSELIHGGSPLEAIKSSFLSIFNNHIKNKGMYNKSESKIKWIDIEDSLLVIISSYSSVTSYSNQTKTSIDNKFIQDFITESIKEQLNVWLIENEMDATKICNQVLINKRSREKANQTRLNIQKKLSETNKGGLSVKIEGLKDCDMRNSNLEERILILTEGLSPAETITQSYDNRIMGSLGLKGRFISSLKCSVEDVLNNEPAMSIIRALGCGVEIPYEQRKQFKDIQTFDISNLRYGTIAITVDADSWGKAIALSLLAFFYKFFPTLLKQNRVVIVVSPRYILETKKGDFEYAYNEQERDQLIEKLGKSLVHIGIVKGIGELDADQFWKYVLCDEARKTTFVTVNYTGLEEDIKSNYDMFIGEDIDARKRYIRENIVKVDTSELL